MAAREHGSLHAQTGSGDPDEVAHAQTRQLAPPQTTEPEDGDHLGIPTRRGAGAVVELVESEELPLAARPPPEEAGCLAENPQRVGKALRFELGGLHSARRGDFRIIYRIGGPVTIVAIEHRADGYRQK